MRVKCLLSIHNFFKDLKNFFLSLLLVSCKLIYKVSEIVTYQPQDPMEVIT